MTKRDKKMRLVLLPQHSHHLAPEHACPDPDGVILGMVCWDKLGLDPLGSVGIRWDRGLGSHLSPDL